MESRLTALGRRVRGCGIEQKRGRTHGHGQQRGDCGVGMGLSGGLRRYKGDKW